MFGLGISESVHLSVTKEGSHCREPPLKVPEEDKAVEEEATMSLADAKETSLEAHEIQ